MAVLPAVSRSLRAFAPSAIAGIFGVGVALHGSARAEPAEGGAGAAEAAAKGDAADKRAAGGRVDGAVCVERWSTSGASRTRRSRVKSWRVQLDLPRASAACTDALEKQVLGELGRVLPTPATTEVPSDAVCRLAHADGSDLAWACRLHWRGDARAPLSAVVGLSGTGNGVGMRFQPAFAGCSADARKAIVADAVETLTPRLREAAAEAARTQPALLTAYREGSTLRVSFGRAMPHEDTESTVGRVAWERMITLCGGRE